MAMRTNNISLLYFQGETDGMEKIQTIYSKARGVTIFSAINKVNNRALRKLKTEASMLGADAILIVNNYQKGVQMASPVQVTYTAIAYKTNPLLHDQVKAAMSGKQYFQTGTAIYNRNAFGHNLNFNYNTRFPVDPDKLYEENGRVMIRLDRNYQVVSISPQQLVLGYYQVPDKVLVNIFLVTEPVY